MENCAKYNLRMKFFLLPFILFVSVACSSSDDNLEGVPANNASFIQDDDEFIALESASRSEYKSAALLVFQDQESFNSHYALTRGNEFEKTNAPTVDFGNEDLIVIHLGERPNSGSSIEIVSITYDSTDNTRQIRYKENTAGISAQVISYPYSMIRVKKSNLEYRFIKL